MRRRSALAMATALLAAVFSLTGMLAPSALAAGPVVDQSFTSTDNVNKLINEGAQFVAQTFTAGRTGLLTGVSVDVFDSSNSRFTLSVAIRTVAADGTPTEVVLGETRADSCCPRLSQILVFDQPVPVVDRKS